MDPQLASGQPNDDTTVRIETVSPLLAACPAEAPALPLSLVPGLALRLAFRPDELAALLGVSKDLVDSWIDSGSAPRARVPGKVRIIPAWWVAQALGGPDDAAPPSAGSRRVPASSPAQPAPATPPRPRAVPSSTTPPRNERTRDRKRNEPAAWAVPPTVGR